MLSRSLTTTNTTAALFASQLSAQHSPATKKFRSSAAPKGSKLATGYIDRTQSRTSTEEDDKASRIKALEEMVKLGQMEQTVFEKLRDEIVGGSAKDVHLVKGLDRKLLERVRRGERVDVLGEDADEGRRLDEKGEKREEAEEADVDVEGELEDLESKEIKPVVKEEKVKKGEMAPPSTGVETVAGKKRNRDDILRELKAARAKAEEEKKAIQPTLGPKFRKLGEQKRKSRIERDEKGREVLVTVDAEGRVKRKVRKANPDKGDITTNANGTADVGDFKGGLLMPDKDVAPLGMEAPITKKPPQPMEEEEVGDIFEGVGAEYDPLGGLEEDDDSSGEEDNIGEQNTAKQITDSPSVAEHMSQSDSIPQRTDPPPEMPPPPPPPSTNSSRNYFNKPDPSTDSPSSPTNPLTDPTILAALKKASTIALPSSTSSSSSSSTSEAEAAKVARRKAMLESHDRDAEDMDLGFGSSRFEDAAEGEEGGKRVKLSVWRGAKADDGEEDGGKGGKEKRKRGGKKRVGDKNSAGDVLRVLERRREGEGKGK